MNFEQAEAKFRELQARVQRGESISRAEYEDQVSQLMVQDQNGVLWEIHPHTGRWMYYDGLEWVAGIPPGRADSKVIPLSSLRAASEEMQRTRAEAQMPKPIRPTPQAGSDYPYPRLPRDQSLGRVPRGVSQPPRALRGVQSRDNLQWIPLAIGAVVLFMCAVLLFVGGQLALNVLKPSATATRVVVALPTRTPIPTIVRPPTSPPPTATPQPVLAKIVEQRVNVRAAPTTASQIVGKLNRNDQLIVVGRNEDGTWYQVQIAGAAELRWVFAETMQIVSGDASQLPVVPAP
jgi:hypothetical protein